MNLRNLRPPWARLSLLIVLAIPCFSMAPFALWAPNPNSFSFVALWIVYSVLISTIIVRSVGVNEWIGWFAAACLLAVVTAGLTTGILSGIKLVGLDTFLYNPDGTPYTHTQWSWDQLRRGIIMVTVIPYAIFVAHSFSVSNAVRRAIELTGRRRWLARKVLISLRVVQHAVEVLPPMLVIWREEHPELILPRLRRDISGGYRKILACSTWLFFSSWTWATALLLFALEPMAMLCYEVELHLPDTGAS
jgi:hypothetical protein